MRGRYPYYRYQAGGERNIVPPMAPVPGLPVVTDPRVFARLHGTSSAGSDSAFSAGVPLRSQAEALLQQQLAEQAAQRRAVEERKMKSRLSHEAVPRLANPKISDMLHREDHVAGDIGAQNFVPQAGPLVAQLDTERDLMQHNLMRLGYPATHAAAFARLGKGRLQPFVQQQLDDLEASDYRVRHHPDFDPQRSVDDQQFLNQDQSLRTRILRGRNMLVDSGNPVTDFVAHMITGPGSSFANLTMDAENQYVKPGPVQGITNLGLDLLNVFPNEAYAAASKIGNSVYPFAQDLTRQAYRINPWAKGNLFNQWNDENYYRIVDEAGYLDALHSNVIRSNPLGDAKGAIKGLSIQTGRPTSFPTFAKGRPHLDYLPRDGGKGYVIESSMPMYKRGDINPVTGNAITGRHWAYRPIDSETGDVLKSIPLDQVSIYEPHWWQGYKAVL